MTTASRARKGIMKHAWHILLILILFFWTCLAQSESETIYNVQLTGGDQAGTYEVTGSDAECLYGTSNGDDWQTRHITEENSVLSTVLLLVPSTAAASSGTTDFFFSAGFGEYSSDEYLEYILDPTNTNGTGSITIQKDGSQATINISGETATGVSVNATITCTNVLEVGADSYEPKALSELGAIRFAPDSTAPTGALELTIADKKYQIQTGEEASCGFDPYDPNLFYYGYYVDGYASLDLYIRASSLEALQQGSSDFLLSIDTTYVAYRTGEGSGTVKATQEGDTVRLAVKVESPEGIPVYATLTCSPQ